MAADDFLNTPGDQGIPDLDTSMSGNRPASGARRATPGEVLSQGFHGAQNAGDFLGLDTEFTASQDPNQVFGSGSPLDLVAPPSTYVDDGSQGGYQPQTVPEPAPMPDGDPAQEFAQAPSAFEFGEDLGSDDGEPKGDADGATSKKPLLVAALLVAGVVGGGMFYGPQLYSRFFGSAASTEVAVTPKAPVAEPKPAPSEGAATARPGETLPDSDVASKPTVPDSTPVASTKEPRKPELTPRATPPTVPGTSVARKSEPEAIPVQPETGSSLPSAQVVSGARPQATSFPDLDSPEYSWASVDQLELIWRGNQVPLEAVHASVKTLMPRVGNVRVFTTSGDVFDGRLYAVGQNRVWVDAQPGRIGLDGDRVAKIEVLAPLADGQELTTGMETPGAGSKRVRVRVPGGMLYGRVLKSEGDEVILALDDGGRVRVKSAELEDLGTGRAVVVRR